jgi:hypothetical protein
MIQNNITEIYNTGGNKNLPQIVLNVFLSFLVS